MPPETSDASDRAATDPQVLVPSGATMLDAATWTGRACWAELRLHQLLTGWLASGTDPTLAPVLWTIRSHRAELAEAWHRRLPELRELPRTGFVEPGAQAEEALAAMEDLTDPVTSADRVAALRVVLVALGDGYRRHVAVAVGPADGPTADTLAAAIARTESDHDLLTPT